MKLGYRPEKIDNWKGKWLGDLSDYFHNNFWKFRKEVELPDKAIKSAIIKVSGETRYHLRVNGKFVCRGPAKCFPDHQSYDTIDIRPFLKPGKNCIAGIVHVYGVSTFNNVWRNRGGFIVDGEVLYYDCESVAVISDKTWKAQIDPARSSEGARLSVQQSFQEIFYAEKETVGWTLAGFDDSKWRQAREAGPVGIPPWYSMEERGTPLLKEEPEAFIRAKTFYEGVNHPDWKNDKDIRKTMCGDKRRKVKEGTIKVERDGLGHVKSFLVNPSGEGKFSAVLLDIGQSSVGCPEVKMLSETGGEVVDFFYTMRSDDEHNFMFAPGDYCDISLYDRFYARKGLQEFRPYNFKGYRYLLLVFRNVKKPFKVLSVFNNSTFYPIERRGKFECSDPFLNKLWKVSEHTLKCCMLDSYVDCPDREQGQWMGDALVELDVNFHSFGDSLLMRRMIRQCAQSQVPNGLLYGVFPGERHKNILPDYNFTWIIAAEKYVYYTGDVSILAEIFPAAVKNFEFFEKHAGEKKLLHYTEGYWLFLDWTNIDSSGICATFNMWYVHALKAMQRVCKVLKQDGSKYAAQEKAVTKAMTKMFYDKKNGVWWESMNLSKGLISQRSQHANALAYLAGLPIGKGSRRELMRPSHLKSKIEHPLASAYFSNYIYESLFGLGEGRTALKNMKAGFGVMLDAGATTLWEHWGNANNYGSWSVCHAWSAHPLQHLTRQVLGLKAAGPKWSKFTFDPWKYGGITWARGKVPTPYGEICAEWEMKNGKISGKTEGPKETLKIQL